MGIVKMEPRGLTIVYAKNKAITIRRKERDLQKRLSDLDQLISSASSADSHRANHLEAEHNQLKQEINFVSSMKTEERAQLFVLKQDGLSRAKNRPNISSTCDRKRRNTSGNCNIYKELYTSITSFEDAQFLSFIENLELPNSKNR